MVRPGWQAGIGTAWLSALVAAASPPSARAADDVSAVPGWTFDNYRPTLTSVDGRFSVSVRARLQIDAAGFDQASDVGVVTPERNVEFKNLDSGALVRRAYLGIEGRAFRDLWYEFRMNFGASDFGISDPYIHLARVSYSLGSYEGGPLLRFSAGLIKPVFTHNDATSSASLTFLERAAVVNVATESFGAGGARLGAELTFQQTDLLRRGDNLVVSGAYTGHVAAKRTSEISDDANSGGTHILGRIAYRLWSDGLSNIQIGSSLSRILTVGGARSLSLQDQPEIQVDGNALADTGPIPATGGGLWGLETAANLRNVYVAAEYYEFGIERDAMCGGCVAAGDSAFSGWYVEGSWMLTGETKTYQANAMNNGMATFANPRVAAPFAFDGRNWGAWEIAARYSELNLDWHAGAAGTACMGPFAGCVRGGQQHIWTVGLNWYLNDSLRVLLDYMVVDVNKLDSTGKQAGQIFSVVGARFQFAN